MSGVTQYRRLEWQAELNWRRRVQQKNDRRIAELVEILAAFPVKP
jgi:hypothetical protein